ncbi:Streptogramin A acetyltransferase [Falsiruegeria litorea R37]|uniref:Streptogramin A acetyltransferase n=1 Tax=Falsiruegeria litorea R37 TaxID=1200284 RepID=A0A1Y5T464_9RHOB|nr:CatB-related O-acetyltransferase [Falsiruegeria litorea]SLN54950.1 Streptogramin A acetyltransferase [Falsiruegeria litorea R37]
MPMPDATRRYPVTLPDGSEHKGTVFLNRVIDHPRFQVGDYTYASDFDPPQDWASHLAPYLFATSTEALRIGKFCQIAHGVRFITSSANHAMDSLTCFPFPVFDPAQMGSYQPDTRDTMIGHDVWIGYGALILPGAQIGTGAIIGAGAVVRGNVPDYGVVTGNPGTVVKSRFDANTIAALLDTGWWDWPAEQIAQAESALLSGDVDALKRI